jgi:hypothetical protein
MAEFEYSSNQETAAEITLGFSVDDRLMDEITPREVILSESLLTPGLQTFVKVHSYIHSINQVNDQVKNFDKFKSQTMTVNIKRPILARFGFEDTMDVSQTIYRLEKRKLYNPNVEEFTLHACDQTLLNDAATLVSKIWKCTKPSDIVSYVLQSCAGAQQIKVEEPCDPARDYKAENIHPFQVVAQQGSVALADGGNDPSFVHYMTYENGGTHRFESLFTMAQQSPVATFQYNEVGTGFADPRSIMHYEFPCDFDVLSDILNSLGPNGSASSMIGINPVTKGYSLLGDQTQGCGLGSTVLKRALSNRNSAMQQNMCPDYADLYLLKRQARMGLLERDKIALRLTVPWNPILHAGKIIEIKLINKENGQENYGTGLYLIHSLIHNVKNGGYATTTLDCVSKTVGTGEV